MNGFSKIFSYYFYKRFPQHKGALSSNQEKNIQKIAEHITSKTNPKELWEEIESNTFLLKELEKRSKYIVSGEKKIFLKILITALFLLSTIFILFREIPDIEKINFLSKTVKILKESLKNQPF